jgi:hypothetical protein
MPFSAQGRASQFLWNYILGPFLAFFPQRWRDKWFAHRNIPWKVATIVSGILQFLLAPFLLLIWSSSAVCSLEQSLGFGCGGGETQTFSLLLLAMNPITWLMIYLVFEGFGRAFAAAMLGETPGTLVLAAPDLLHLYIKRRRARGEVQLADLVTQDDIRSDWQLKIESARPKRDWRAGRILKYGERFYTIESCHESGGARPSVYQLRRLPMGVSSPSVIIYPSFEIAEQLH